MKEAVIFDFDGTLADSREVAHRIYNQLAPDYGIRQVPEEEIPELRHLKLRELIRTLGVKQRHLPSLVRRGKVLLRKHLHELKPCPGVFEQLPEICSSAGLCGILTSNSVENVEIFLERHGVRDCFQFISSCRKLQGKAKYLRRIARTYTLKPADMVYVGDEVRDVRAAQKAGVPMIAVGWGFNSLRALRESQPDWLVEDAIALTHLLARSHPGH